MADVQPPTHQTYQPYGLQGLVLEPAWIVSIQPANDAAAAEMAKATEAGTTQALSDTILRKHYRAIERRREREAKGEANG